MFSMAYGIKSVIVVRVTVVSNLHFGGTNYPKER